MQILGLSRREQHAAPRQDRSGIKPTAEALLATALSPDPRPTKTVPRHTDAVGKHRDASLARLRILVRPQERAGRKIDGDDGTGTGRTDEHSLGERGRESGEPPGMAVTIVDRSLLIDLGERLRPLQPTSVAIEHIQPDLPLLLDEHEQLFPHGQWSTEIPCRGRQCRVVAGTAAGGKPPSQAAAIGDVVGGDRVAPPPATGHAHAHSLHGRPEVHATRLRLRHGIGMALDHEYQSTIARHSSAGGIVEDGCERPSGIGLGIGGVGATVTTSRGGRQRHRAGPGLQPDPLPCLEVDRQQPHGGAHQDHAIHRQRRAGR